jgi:hypothetical protein
LRAVRERLASSHLVRSGGVVRRRVLDPVSLQTLADDALAAHAHAEEARVEDTRGRARGDPDRWLESATAGDALDRFTRSEELLSVLREETGVAWVPAGPGTWSYYRRAGHHLGLHRDIAVCDLAVITCVVDEGGTGDSGLLRTWPGRVRDPLDAVRRDPRGHVDVRARAGDTILLLGGLVAHQVLPLADGHLRVVAPVCYQPKPRTAWR